jgi:dCMP deaminase
LLDISLCEILTREKMTQKDWDTYFMQFAKLASTRSHCLRRKVGAVLVKDRMILATGYNGPPKGVAHCDATGCLREQLQVPSGQRHELCRGLHAEQNVLVQSAYHGIAIADAVLYTDTYPCCICFKMLLNAGITEVVYEKEYDDPLTDLMLKDIKFSIRKFS